jgi:hypothetical protein
MIGRYGATLGKMAAGIRVVRSDGSQVGYPLAIARYFAKLLSGIVCGTGYIMAAFDPKKRALHDTLCGTLVITKNSALPVAGMPPPPDDGRSIEPAVAAPPIIRSDPAPGSAPGSESHQPADFSVKPPWREDKQA